MQRNGASDLCLLSAARHQESNVFITQPQQSLKTVQYQYQLYASVKRTRLTASLAKHGGRRDR